MVETSKGLRWHRIRVGDYTIDITPMNIVEERLPDCDSKGNELEKRQIQKAEYKFYNKDGTEYVGNVFKIKDGKPIKKTNLTTEVDEFLETDVREYYDLKDEHEYFVECSDRLKEYIRTKNIAFKFPFNSGFGYKPSVAVMGFDVKGYLTMRVGRVFRSTIANEINCYAEAKAKSNAKLKAISGEENVETIKGEMI